MDTQTRHFNNELDHPIDVRVSQKGLAGVDGVLLYISGPTSETEVHITRLEAEVLYEELTKILTKP